MQTTEPTTEFQGSGPPVRPAMVIGIASLAAMPNGGEVVTVKRLGGDGEPVFIATQPRLYAIALRVLGDGGEAEDIVQEAWLRWMRADRSDVHSPPAFLAVTTTRLALNVAVSARRRHESPAGSWLPEVADRDIGPEAQVERREAVAAAVRLMLERLTPSERAAYLLRTAFDYPYRRISEVLHLGVAHTRQLVRRGHAGMDARRRRPVDATTHQRLVRTFLAAARTGDLADLENLLAADLVSSRSRPATGSFVR